MIRTLRDRAARRSGQAMIFILMVLVILVFVALWQFDLHKTIFVKYKNRNGGDGAAIAAARWQGISLNLIGELNMLQAVALSQSLAAGDTNFVEARAIGDLAARVAYTGPMVALLSSQEAAKNNGLFVNADFTRDMASHADEVRQEYATRYPDPPYHNDPEPPTAWDDYADMISEVASLGIAANPDNAKLYLDYMDWEHFLLNPAFYDAIGSRDWCWFWFNARSLLNTYGSWRDWPPLPIYQEPRPASAEYYGLGVRRVSRLSSFGTVWFTNSPLTGEDIRVKLEGLSGQSLDTGIVDVAANWLFYRDEVWSDWTTFLGDDFPFRGEVKPEYNYVGADAAVRVITDVDRLTPGINSEDVTWSAAAKPLGSLEGSVRPNTYGVVLPAFTDARMIPVDASTAPPGGTRPGWGIHIHDHLPNYVQRGLDGLDPGCWYCAQLRTWEDFEFRQTGIDWLRDHSSECRVPPPGGGGQGGGASRGH